MAFKNFDVAKKYAIGIEEEKTVVVPEETASAETVSVPKKEKQPRKKVEKPADGGLDLKNFSEKEKKSTSLNIRITMETKKNIDALARKHGISQSDLISALVAYAMKQG